MSKKQTQRIVVLVLVAVAVAIAIISAPVSDAPTASAVATNALGGKSAMGIGDQMLLEFADTSRRRIFRLVTLLDRLRTNCWWLDSQPMRT